MLTTWSKKLLSLTILGALLASGSFLLPRAAQAAPANLLLNPGFELVSGTQTANWQPFGIGFTRTTSTKRTGTAGLRLQTTQNTQQAGAYQRIDLQQTSLQPVFIGGYVRGDNIRLASGGYFGATLYAEIHMNDGSVAYWNSIANVGTFTWRWIGFNTGTVTNITKPIDHIFVVPILTHARGTAYFDDLAAYQYAPAQAAVTIMFDDGETTTYTVGKPALDKYGFKGTSAVISSYVGDSGYMNSTRLKALQTAGWEIVSHSVNHEDMTSLSTTQITNELKNSKSSLTNLGLTITNFAMPFGAYNGYILAEAAKYYASARAYEQGDNPQGTFPFEVKVRGLVASHTAADVSNLLQQAKQQNRWVVLVFHSLTNTGDDEYHTPPATFRSMVDAIAASGVQVVTYDQGLKLFGTQP